MEPFDNKTDVTTQELSELDDTRTLKLEEYCGRGKRICLHPGRTGLPTGMSPSVVSTLS